MVREYQRDSAITEEEEAVQEKNEKGRIFFLYWRVIYDPVQRWKATQSHTRMIFLLYQIARDATTITTTDDENKPCANLFANE